MSVVTINARLLHHARLGIANDGLTVDLGEVMNRFLPGALSQTQQRVALEVILRPAVNTPWKRIVAVLTDLDASLTVLVQPLAHVVQKCCGNAEWNGIRCGGKHLVDWIMRPLNALD